MYWNDGRGILREMLTRRFHCHVLMDVAMFAAVVGSCEPHWRSNKEISVVPGTPFLFLKWSFIRVKGLMMCCLAKVRTVSFVFHLCSFSFGPLRHRTAVWLSTLINWLDEASCRQLLFLFSRFLSLRSSLSLIASTTHKCNSMPLCIQSFVLSVIYAWIPFSMVTSPHQGRSNFNFEFY